ncbi:MAG: hypothetical protein AAF677_18685, partial [Pseudomonadota bacterium]
GRLGQRAYAVTLPTPMLRGIGVAADPGAVDAFALEALSWVKTLPVAWEAAPVGIVANRAEDAALVWFIASELAGVRNVWVVPGPVSLLAAPPGSAGTARTPG